MASAKVSLLYGGTVSGETKEKAMASIQSFVDNPLLHLCNGSEYLRKETTVEVVDEDSDLIFATDGTIGEMVSLTLDIRLFFDVDVEYASSSCDIAEALSDEHRYYENLAPEGFEFVEDDVVEVYSLDEERYGDGRLDPAFSSWYEVNSMFV